MPLRWSSDSALRLNTRSRREWSRPGGVLGSLQSMLDRSCPAIPGVRVLDRGPELCAIVTIAVDGQDTANIKLALRSRGINTSSPQREDAVIDMDEKGTASALRISPHYYNTQEEIDTAVDAIQELLSS